MKERQHVIQHRHCGSLGSPNFLWLLRKDRENISPNVTLPYWGI